jgi:hypothetical protein
MAGDEYILRDPRRDLSEGTEGWENDTAIWEPPQAKMPKNMKDVVNGQTYILVVAVLVLVVSLVVLGLDAWNVSKDKAKDSVVTTTVYANTSTVCGTANGCYSCIKRTLTDGSTDIVRNARPAGTVCSDVCVSSGTCTGFDPLDDNRRSSYCNATSYAACRGSCSTFADCILPAWMGSMSTSGFAVCIDGSCLSSILFIDNVGNPPPTVLYPYFTDDDPRAGPDAEICRWIIQDGLDVSNSKNCLDYDVFGYTSGSNNYYGCNYMHQCARPNFWGTDAPPFSVTSLVGSSDNTTLTLSVPPSIADLFVNVTNAGTLTTALGQASVRLATQTPSSPSNVTGR